MAQIKKSLNKKSDFFLTSPPPLSDVIHLWPLTCLFLRSKRISKVSLILSIPIKFISELYRLCRYFYMYEKLFFQLAGRLRPAFSARRQPCAAARGLRSRRSNRSGGWSKNLYDADDDDHKKAPPQSWALEFILSHFWSFLLIFSQMSVLKQLSEEFESVDAF